MAVPGSALVVFDTCCGVVMLFSSSSWLSM